MKKISLYMLVLVMVQNVLGASAQSSSQDERLISLVFLNATSRSDIILALKRLNGLEEKFDYVSLSPHQALVSDRYMYEQKDLQSMSVSLCVRGAESSLPVLGGSVKKDKVVVFVSKVSDDALGEDIISMQMCRIDVAQSGQYQIASLSDKTIPGLMLHYRLSNKEKFHVSVVKSLSQNDIFFGDMSPKEELEGGVLESISAHGLDIPIVRSSQEAPTVFDSQKSNGLVFFDHFKNGKNELAAMTFACPRSGEERK